MKYFLMLGLFFMISTGASAEDIPNDEIWYTSSDGKVVTPHGSYAFGANIVSPTLFSYLYINKNKCNSRHRVAVWRMRHCV